MKLPALRFEAEAFSIRGERIMGRQAAGEAFLRAMVALAAEDPLIGFGPQGAVTKAFGESVQAISPSARTAWVPSTRPELLAAVGGVHFPDPGIADHARTRLRHGPAAWSVTGVTHTISSQAAMRFLADIPLAPLMPWDAVICTSQAVKTAVETTLALQEEYLAWRCKGAQPPERPALPVIPLGVHCADFEFTQEQRQLARTRLQLADDEVAFLFLGRLSFHAKAHPHPMYVALEQVARETGRRITLIQCGWFANEFIGNAFKQGATDFAPSVRHVFLDGRDPGQRDEAWSASDVFISLVDNIQETFGLTPLEAMAAGKPVIVTDWDGYRETVPHDVAGLRIPTWMAPAPVGEAYANGYASGTIDYDRYIGLAAQHISVDMRALVEAVRSLVTRPQLRASLGEGGRRTARADFDWRVVIARYGELWRDLGRLRESALQSGATPFRRASADRRDPFDFFAHYPTHLLDSRTQVKLRTASRDWRPVASHPLFRFATDHLGPAERIEALCAVLDDTHWQPVHGVVEKTGQSMPVVLGLISALAKWGIVELDAGPLPGA